MLRKKILIFSLLLPLYAYPQESDQEAIPDVQIGSSGIDLAPEEEISTPTESPAIDTAATAQPEHAPEAPPAESTPAQ